MNGAGFTFCIEKVERVAGRKAEKISAGRRRREPCISFNSQEHWNGETAARRSLNDGCATLDRRCGSLLRIQ